MLSILRRFQSKKIAWGGLLVAPFVVGGIGALQAQSPTASTTGKEVRIEYDYRRGVDMAQYIPVHGEAACGMKICKNNVEAREETKDRAYKTAFERIDQLGRTYSLAREHYLEGFRQLTNSSNPSVLKEDVRFIKATEIYDYKHSEYKYTVDLAVRRVPRLDPQLDVSLKNFLTSNGPKREDGNLIFDLTDILDKLEKDEQFSALLDKIRNDLKGASSFRFKDDDTQIFFNQISGTEVKIQGYEKGQYSVNALIGSIIERSVAVAVQSSLRDYSLVKVVCEGATDRLRISGNIKYSGKARRALPGKQLRLSSEEGTSMGDGIRDNLALSFARGHEGIDALAQMLGPRLRSGRIELYYTGLGEVAGGSGNHPESRRIRFRVIPGPRIR